jgi:hypothetical protein
MSSIFIWKSDKPNRCDKKITYYNGSDWFLEDHSNYSKSYKYINQYSFTTLTNRVLYYEMNEMPSDWVGNYLLEKYNEIPYSLLKEDEYAILDQIGIWLRCKIKLPIEFEEKQLEEQWITLQKWLKEPIKKQMTVQHHFQNRPIQYQMPIQSVPYMNSIYKKPYKTNFNKK